MRTESFYSESNFVGSNFGMSRLRLFSDNINSLQDIPYSSSPKRHSLVDQRALKIFEEDKDKASLQDYFFSDGMSMTLDVSYNSPFIPKIGEKEVFVDQNMSSADSDHIHNVKSRTPIISSTTQRKKKNKEFSCLSWNFFSDEEINETKSLGDMQNLSLNIIGLSAQKADSLSNISFSHADIEEGNNISPINTNPRNSIFTNEGSNNLKDNFHVDEENIGKEGKMLDDKEFQISMLHESSSRNHANKKPENYDIQLHKMNENHFTTLMIKNIPNKYTQKMLLDKINSKFEGAYDFFYVPIDYKNKCNVGYAFINMIKPIFVKDFYIAFHNTKWEKFKSEKICEIKYARIQGLEDLKKHFEASNVMTNSISKYKPLLISSNGKAQKSQT